MSRTRTIGPRLVGCALVLVAATVLTSCVQVPDHGAVVEARQRGQAEPAQPPFNNPLPPTPGAAPDDIVVGFLDAMTATPLSPHRAAEFLTKRARARWQPAPRGGLLRLLGAHPR